MRICAKPYIMSERIKKLFQKAKPYTFQNQWTNHFEEEIVTENLFTQESFLTKSLEVERRNTFPNHRKVTHFKTRCGGGGRSVP